MAAATALRLQEEIGLAILMKTPLYCFTFRIAERRLCLALPLPLPLPLPAL